MRFFRLTKTDLGSRHQRHDVRGRRRPYGGIMPDSPRVCTGIVVSNTLVAALHNIYAEGEKNVAGREGDDVVHLVGNTTSGSYGPTILRHSHITRLSIIPSINLTSIPTISIDYKRHNDRPGTRRSLALRLRVKPIQSQSSNAVADCASSRSLIWKPPPHYGTYHNKRTFDINNSHISQPDLRVPGYIENYVRRFWQV